MRWKGIRGISLPIGGFQGISLSNHIPFVLETSAAIISSKFIHSLVGGNEMKDETNGKRNAGQMIM